jgi:hypothetical protein
MHGYSIPFYQITWHDVPADLLVVGMTTRDHWAHMLAVSLRSLSKHGTHKSPSDRITTLHFPGAVEPAGGCGAHEPDLVGPGLVACGAG